MLLDRLLQHDWKHVVYVSSVAVYGDRDLHAHAPEDPATPHSAYARRKLTCEALVLSAAGCVARLSNAYGPGMASNNVLSIILDQLGSPDPIRLRRLDPLRDFIHVSDCASALAAMAAQRPQGIMNVASGRVVSVAELAAIAAKEAGQQGRAMLATEPTETHTVLRVDIGRTMSVLGWCPRVKLEDGVSDLVSLRHG
jgi:nucleoside-diphosphate-sugar epimerase